MKTARGQILIHPDFDGKPKWWIVMYDRHGQWCGGSSESTKRAAQLAARTMVARIKRLEARP